MEICVLMSIKNWATCWSNFRPPKHKKLISIRLLGKCLLESVAVSIDVQNMSIVGEPIQQCCRHLFIAQNFRPLRKFKVCGDDEVKCQVQRLLGYALK